MVTFELKILGLDRVNSLLLGLVGFRFFFILLKLGFGSFDFFSSQQIMVTGSLCIHYFLARVKY